MKMSHTTALLGALLGLNALSASAHADTFLGIYADAAYQSYDGKLEFSQKNTAPETFDFDKESTPALSVALEHGVPFIPNIKVRHAGIEGNKTKKVTAFTFGNQVYTDTATASLDVTHTDVIAYYEILDNVISMDLGLGAKIIEGDVSVKSALYNEKEDLSATVPMVYAAAGGSLPFTGFSAAADVAGFSYDDNRVVDASARVQYDFIKNIALDVGAFAGYRVVDVKIADVKNTDATGSFKGPQLGLAAHF